MEKPIKSGCVRAIPMLDSKKTELLSPLLLKKEGYERIYWKCIADGTGH